MKARYLGAAPLHDAGDVSARSVGQAILLHGGILARPDLEIDGIDACRTDRDKDLTRVGAGLFEAIDAERVIVAEMMKSDFDELCHIG
ncbi:MULTISPECIES: hypothetical protein [unclassified Bradyrhizobium]|uniref:hypothetical protein n=1 Tax=unclassified Bradyrhizobium TaxID=2631580 RepID=UPI002479939F|nr:MULTISPECIES: hypothetical protein [unclassified Bradyrhizobium]WGR75365.1 hypothetical protein MTX24_07080 [Bradyrhizobium sp. ISRA426]WGR82992.1 hypothetical protein MTX21_32030 [Bradyrhizobium sp. ISRA430]WGR90569.1 hypothetical protein MTX25_07080 [Bradyrhizobium sp. ISRA432]